MITLARPRRTHARVARQKPPVQRPSGARMSEITQAGVLKDAQNPQLCMRTTDGALWPMPINLDVDEKFAEGLEIGQDIALRDQEGVILATMTVTDRWEPNKAHEAEKVFGADDSAHPAVNYLHNHAGKIYLGGPVTGIQQPVHYDFRARREVVFIWRMLFIVNCLLCANM